MQYLARHIQVIHKNNAFLPNGWSKVTFLPSVKFAHNNVLGLISGCSSRKVYYVWDVLVFW